MGIRLDRNNWVYYIGRGSNLRTLLLSIGCLLILLGSSFRPAPGPMSARGGSDINDPAASEEIIMPEPEDKLVKYSVYEVKKGDTLSEIADDFDVSLDTLISINGFTSAKSLRPKQLLKVPDQSGIIYVASKASTVQEIADSYSISADRIIDANGLLSENITSGRPLFLPDVRLPAAKLREIAGTLFQWPVRGRITSWFGWRKDPFTGRRSFHNAVDIAAPYGSSIAAPMDGRVIETAYSPILGKYVMMSHSGGWKTLYGHMSEVLVKEGQYVSQGRTLGRIGTTGYSTGPHVHFEVIKNGALVNPLNYLP
jgi:murein DD-endopeptidase MepM/ murein hydrolase activator NlpD